jgi:hypothetical protein
MRKEKGLVLPINVNQDPCTGHHTDYVISAYVAIRWKGKEGWEDAIQHVDTGFAWFPCVYK